MGPNTSKLRKTCENIGTTCENIEQLRDFFYKNFFHSAVYPKQVARSDNDAQVQPPQELVSELHEQYCKALAELFDEHKGSDTV